MPFRKSARIAIENQRWEDIGGFFYQITYELDDVPDDAAYFHAQWRRRVTTDEYPEHVILDGIKGKGQYVGTYLAWTQLSNGWWGEGEIKFFMDGDKEYPDHLRHRHRGLLRRRLGLLATTVRRSPPPFLGYPLWQQERRRGAQARPLPLAHPGPDPLRAGPEGDDPGAGLVAERQVPAAARRHRLGRLLVPDRAARQFPEMLPVHLRWPR